MENIFPPHVLERILAHLSIRELESKKALFPNVNIDALLTEKRRVIAHKYGVRWQMAASFRSTVRPSVIHRGFMFRMANKDEIDETLIAIMFASRLEACPANEREIAIAFLVSYVKVLFSLVASGYFDNKDVPLVGGLGELRLLLMQNVQNMSALSYIGIGIISEKANLFLL